MRELCLTICPTKLRKSWRRYRSKSGLYSCRGWAVSLYDSFCHVDPHENKNANMTQNTAHAFDGINGAETMRTGNQP